jgi:hypothetical protein
LAYETKQQQKNYTRVKKNYFGLSAKIRSRDEEREEK